MSIKRFRCCRAQLFFLSFATLIGIGFPFSNSNSEENSAVNSSVRIGNLQLTVPAAMTARIATLNMSFSNLTLASQDKKANNDIYLGLTPSFAERLASYADKQLIERDVATSLEAFLDFLAARGDIKQTHTVYTLLEIDDCKPMAVKKISGVNIYPFECVKKPSVVYYALNGVGDLYYAKGIVFSPDLNVLAGRATVAN